MLFPAALHPRLADGSVTAAFRRWRRPSVRSGGTLRYPGGVLAIDEVARITLEEVTEADARAAGAAGKEAILEQLAGGGAGEPYRIRFHHLGDDPRMARARDTDLDDAAIQEIRTRLARFDASSRRGPWTRATLALIADRPGVAAAALAEERGSDRDVFKRDVRKLKELGLTRSLAVGYELSPRGRGFCARDPG